MAIDQQARESAGGVVRTVMPGVTPRPFSAAMEVILGQAREAVAEANRLMDLVDQAAALCAEIDLSNPSPADRVKLKAFSDAAEACGRTVREGVETNLVYLLQFPVQYEQAGLQERQQAAMRADAERAREERGRRYREQEAAEERRRELLRQGHQV